MHNRLSSPSHMIPEETVERVLQATDIVDLIQSYFPLRKMGLDYMALCPFHNEKSPSFSVSPSKQMFYCFGCGAGGGAARFLMDYETLDFPSAIKRLGERAGIPVLESEMSPEAASHHRQRQQLLALHRDAAAWFHQNLLKRAFASHARDYLKGREITIEVARSWQLGFAPEDPRVLFEWADQRKVDRRLLIDSGIAVQREGYGNRVGARFRNRLMFPVCNDLGEVIAFSGRTLDSEASVAKYLNSPETALFSKSKTLFGLHRSKRPILKASKAIICEGQLDLITCFEKGVENIVAPLGTAFTEDHARIIKRHTQEVVICFDADPAGFKAARRTFNALAEHSIFVRAVEMPQGADPDSFVRKKGVAAFREIVDDARDFLEFHINYHARIADMGSPRVVHQLAQELAESVSLVTDKLMQDTIIHSISGRLGLSDEEFRNSVLSAGRKRKRWRKNDKSQNSDNSVTKSEPEVFFDPVAKLLCQAMLLNSQAKEWVCDSVLDESVFQQISDKEIVETIAKGRFEAGQVSSVNGYVAQLGTDMERALNSLMAKPPEGDHFKAAQDAWKRIENSLTKQQLREREAALKQPNLDSVKMMGLLVEIRALKEKLDRA